jgi:ACS family hexuronate transporter-like MFS transporter
MPARRRRWLILGIIFCAIVLNYFDRQIVSILKPTLKAEFHLDDAGYAVIANIFTLCYAIMYPVAGLLVDRFGAGRMMLAGMICWSASCLAGGLARTLAQLAIFRGTLGLAEPIGFPAQLRAVAAWFPGSLRATANSISVAGGSMGAVIAPSLIAWITLSWNWQAAFFVPGLLGLLVAALWWGIYCDPPEPVASDSITENVATKSEPAFKWTQLWRTRSLWAILLCRFISDPVWYFCLFWLPGYLQEKSGLSLRQIGLVGWIPFLAADLGGIGSAAWSDRMVKRGTPPLRARKIMLVTVACLAPVCVLTPHLPHPAVTLGIFSIVGAICLSWLFSLSVVIAETFPQRNIGSVLGIAGGFGAAGAMVFNYYVGQMIGTLGAAKLFAVMALLHPVAAIILWTLVRREAPSANENQFSKQ